MTAREDLIIQAKDIQQKLPKLALRLTQSFEASAKCDFSNPSSEELMILESLTARFERALDILVRSFFRILDLVEDSTEGTIVDVLNRAEKRGIIENASDFLELRYKRNVIAHDYLDVEALTMAAFVREKTSELLKALARAQEYPIR